MTQEVVGDGVVGVEKKMRKGYTEGGSQKMPHCEGCTFWIIKLKQFDRVTLKLKQTIFNSSQVEDFQIQI